MADLIPHPMYCICTVCGDKGILFPLPDQNIKDFVGTVMHEDGRRSCKLKHLEQLEALRLLTPDEYRKR